MTAATTDFAIEEQIDRGEAAPPGLANVLVQIAYLFANGVVTHVNPAPWHAAPSYTPIVSLRIEGAPDCHLVRWLAQEIAWSDTARFVRLGEDKDHALISAMLAPIYKTGTVEAVDAFTCFVRPRHTEAGAYARWIASWIETRWTERLGEYLQMAAEALREDR